MENETPFQCILLVDDDANTNYIHQSYLKRIGLAEEVITVTNGQLALDYLQNGGELPDLILLDLNMPVMDGFEFLEHFEKLNLSSHAGPVVIISSSDNENHIHKAERYGAVRDYLVKPIYKQQWLRIAEKFGRG